MSLVAVLPIGVALFALWIAFRYWSDGKLAEQWPTASGRILESGETSSTDSEGTTYAMYVRYEYTVGGQRYESTSICPGGPFYTSITSWIRKAIAKYPPGAIVEIHHHPKDPSKAFLETWPRSCWPLLIVAAAFGGTGLMILVMD